MYIITRMLSCYHRSVGGSVAVIYVTPPCTPCVKVAYIMYCIIISTLHHH